MADKISGYILYFIHIKLHVSLTGTYGLVQNDLTVYSIDLSDAFCHGDI